MDVTSATSASPSTLTVHVAIGQFFLIIFLITELVIRPLHEIFKDDMVHCAARRSVTRGNAVQIRSAPFVLRALGIHTLITGRSLGFVITQTIRIALIILLIAATALFDRKIESDKVAVVSTFSTTSWEGDIVNVSEGRAVLMSPVPLFGINEQDAGNITAFTSTGSNSSSHYAVREDANLAAQFISSCVRQLNDSYTVVYTGAVIQSDDVQKVRCLDGTNGSENRTAATFFSNPAAVSQPSVQTVTLSRLRNENGISSDRVSGVFGADVLDENGVTYSGYVAVTKNSHSDSNVVWSMYGMVRSTGPFVYRVNIRLYLSGETDPEIPPCFDENPSIRYVGQWSFDGAQYTCPDGISRPTERMENEELQSISLEMFSGSDEVQFEENADLLAWLLETDFALFAAAKTFALEMRTRVRSDRMFYSLYEGETIKVTTGKTEDVVTLGLWETWLLLGAIVALLLSIVLSSAWKVYQRWRLGIKSDVVSLESVADMYASEVRKCAYPGEVLLQVGLVKGADGGAHLGIVEKDSGV